MSIKVGINELLLKFKVYSIDRSSAWLIINSVCLSVIITLYLSPTAEKYLIADLIIVLMLPVWLYVIRPPWKVVLSTIKVLLPLLFLLLYVILFDVYTGNQSGESYIWAKLAGVTPFFLMYMVFRSIKPEQMKTMVIAIFILPGLIHLAYMYLDILLSILRGDLQFKSSSNSGILEYVKNSPRVGRRYLSIALIHLLAGGLVMSYYFRCTSGRYWGAGIVFVSIMSLALLDARAAYVSLFIGSMLLVIFTGPKIIRAAYTVVAALRLSRKIILLVLLILVISIGYAAGKSRWQVMGYSVNSALTDVFYTDAKPFSRPYINMNYWATPEDVEKCRRERRFRCIVDQSAYLRIAWLLTGLQSVIEYPLGRGYSPQYFRKVFGLSGDTRIYKQADSFLVELLITSGFPGLIFYTTLWTYAGYRLRRALRREHIFTPLLLTVSAVIFICVGRSFVDVFSDGLWRYFLALIGVYYGMLHSGLIFDRRHRYA